MHACTVLAAGMRVTRALDRLVLDDNPIGLDGGVAIVEALARGYVRRVTLANCNFANSGLAIQRANATAAAPASVAGAAAPAAAAAAAARGPTAFDVKRPNRVYRLQLAHVADYNVAGTLVQYWAHDTTAGGPWKSATLDGKVPALLLGLPCCCCASADFPVGMNCASRAEPCHSGIVNWHLMLRLSLMALTSLSLFLQAGFLLTGRRVRVP